MENLEVVDKPESQSCKICHNLLGAVDRSFNLFRMKELRVSEVLESYEAGCKFCGYLWRVVGCPSNNSARLTLDQTEHRMFGPEELGGKIKVQRLPFQKEVEIYAQEIDAQEFLESAGGKLSIRAESTWAMIRECLSRCESHKHCQLTKAKNPTRLLRIDAAQETVFLEEMPRTPMRRYNALSHCWGAGQPIRLTKKSYRDLVNGLKWTILPQTFRDAITVATIFGIKYLWIDSLCILQDSAEDWAKEASLMAQVYSNAYFTIIAAASPTCSVSFLDKAFPQIRFLGKSARLDRKESLVARERALGGFHKESDPTDSRAWTLQEKVLSRRVLIFSTGDVQWECREIAVCDCSGLARPRSVFPGFTQVNMHFGPRLISDCNTKTAAIDNWYDIVNVYSSRNLTKDKDKLVALSGIASLFSNIINSQYIAGLWKCDFAYGLNWRVSMPSRLPTTYQAPSFSWASLAGMVFTPQKSGEEYTNHFKLKSVHVSFVAKDIFGQVSGAAIQISGDIAEAWMQYGYSIDGRQKGRRSYSIRVDGVFDTAVMGGFEFFRDAELLPCATLAYKHANTPTEEEQKITVKRSSLSSDGSWGPRRVWLLRTLSQDREVLFLVLGKSYQHAKHLQRLGLLQAYLGYYQQDIEKKFLDKSEKRTVTLE